MTREEAKYFDNDSCGYDGVSFYAVNERIDQIYNDHEEQIKAKDKEIETLKTEFRHMQDIAIKKDVELCKALEQIEELKD